MLVLAVLLLAGPQADTAAAAKPVCRVATATPAKNDARPAVRPLGREPNATQVLAVLRTEGGCITPVVVSESVGSTAKP